MNTGSNKVQFNLLNSNIEVLSYHVKKHPGDFQAKRSLIIKRHQLKIIKRNILN